MYLSAALMIILASCAEHEPQKTAEETEAELERRYGMDFQLVSKDSSDKYDDWTTCTFRDPKGTKFSVKCVTEVNIMMDSHVEYNEASQSGYGANFQSKGVCRYCGYGQTYDKLKTA